MRAALLAALLAGCFDGTAPPCTVTCAVDDDCPSGLACNGSQCNVGGEACMAQSCELVGAHRCTGATLQICSAAGTWDTDADCAGPCLADGSSEARCQYIQPTISELTAVCDTPAAREPRAYVTRTLTTGPGTADCTAGVRTQGPTSPDICLVRASTIAIPAGTVLTVRGTRTLALVADGDIVVAGVIDASAAGVADGPGGGLAAARISGVSPAAGVGGTGAGFRTVGGTGASNSGGMIGTDASTSTVLAGGYRAVAGSALEGGGGGGGIALISCSGRVTVAGLIDAAGGGGAGGSATGTPPAGAGGGSGGVVLLQAFRVMIDSPTGGVFANGGGGGGGGAGGPGSPGGDGPRETGTGGHGGPGAGGDGDGGRGGYGAELPANSVLPGPGSVPGGGGGSVGYIIVSTPSGTSSIDAATPISPPVSITNASVR